MTIRFIHNSQGRRSELKNTGAEQTRQYNELHAQLSAWLDLRKNTASQFSVAFEEKLGVAFASFSELSRVLIVETSDVEISYPEGCRSSGLLDAVRDTKSSFEALHAMASETLQNLGTDSQNSFEEAAISNMIDQLTNFKKSVEAECQAVSDTTDRYRNDFSAAQWMFEDAERRLQTKESELDDNPLCAMFINKDEELRPLRCDKETQEQNRDALGWKHTYMRELLETEQAIIADLNAHITELQSTQKQTQAEERNITTAKNGAFEVYSKIDDMGICLERPDKEVDKSDCVRHILRLMQVKVTVVDDDVHVVEAKRCIDGYIHEHFTEEQAKELEKTPKYINVEQIREGVDANIA